MKRHRTFEDISKNVEIQNALRDLYDHPDKVELYPGVFCESLADKNAEYVFSYYMTSSRIYMNCDIRPMSM